MNEGNENFPANTAHSELDYLWESMRTLEADASRAHTDREKTRQEAAALTARLGSLERSLKRAMERETLLKTELAGLKSELETGARAITDTRKLGKSLEDFQKREAALREELARKSDENSALQLETGNLRSELARLKGTLDARQRSLEVLQGKINVLLSIGEIAERIAAEALATGKTASVYDALAAELGSAKALEEKHSRETGALKAAVAKTAGRAKELETENSSCKRALRVKSEELAALNAELRLKTSRLSLSAAEILELEGRLSAALSAEEGLENRLKKAETCSAEYREKADREAARASALELELAGQRVKTEEQQGNFADAVKQVFELQQKAAALRRALQAGSQNAVENRTLLENKNPELEKLNSLLRERSADIAQEKELHKKTQGKAAALSEDVAALNDRLSKSQDHAAALLHRLEEKEKAIADLKEENKRVDTLLYEIEDLKRRNLRLTGFIKREQFDFNEKISANLEKASKGMKGFSLRLSAAERRAFELPLKNLLEAAGLIKSWQEYMDEETPELSEENLARFLSAEAARWETSFRVKKLELSRHILAPRVTARINAQKLKLAFLNIITNAYEHLQAGGSLKLVLKTSESGSEAVFGFEDSGPGFSPEALDKLFLPFNPGGKGKPGIGLAVADAIARKHGGRLAAQNGKSRGASVELFLPVAKELPK